MDEALNLDVLKMETEVTGEQIVKEIQEWLLTQAGSAEATVLPEDRTQHLLVGVCSPFFKTIYNFISFLFIMTSL